MKHFGTFVTIVVICIFCIIFSISVNDKTYNKLNTEKARGDFQENRADSLQRLLDSTGDLSTFSPFSRRHS